MRAEIATHHKLDCTEFESLWGQVILSSPYPFKPTLGPTQPPIKWEIGLLSGDKAAGAWR